MFPEADAFADDVTLSASCEPKLLKNLIKDFNRRLDLLARWGEQWQVKFATHKTQFLIIWRTQLYAVLKFGQSILINENLIEILGLNYDHSLSFQLHIRKIASKAAGKITALRRITWLVNREERVLLYKAQIRPVLEFSPLTWGGAAATHLGLLDKVQRRAERLINGEDAEEQLHTLQHRRDVAGLCVMYKIHEMGVEHLSPLRQAPRPVPRVTRAAAADTTQRALKEGRSHTLHHQLTFLPRYTRLWNKFVTSAPKEELEPSMRSLHRFKCATNEWLLSREQ